MAHPLLIRILLGAAGLAGCLAVLSGVARAADISNLRDRPIIVSTVLQPNIFGTATLTIKPGRYVDEWERARRDASRHPQMQALIAPARGLNPAQQIAFVQAAVHHRIGWRSDATEWGRHDYWASAQETLEHGVGDMEDRAIVKMQALRALGFHNRDLYLTMGRDKVGGPVTVLIVRRGGRYFVLDDSAGTPFTTDRRPEFTPMLTFGFGGSWIHGYRYVGRIPDKQSPVTASVSSTFAAH